MSEPTRDDLRAIRPNPYRLSYRRITAAEFDAICRKEGYVRLDVDVEKLKKMASDPDPREHLMGMLNLLFVVLAALDPEDTEGQE